jgi:hypothetical protein
MLAAYLDESGNEPTTSGSVFVLAGLMAKADKWAPFTEDWAGILRESPSISYWRTSADFREVGVTKEQLSLKAEKLARVIKKHGPIGIDFCMSWKDFTQAQQEVPNGDRIQPYEMLFHGVLASITYYLESNKIPGKIEFVFDCNGKAGRKVIEGYHSIKNLLSASDVERIGDVIQRDDKHTNPLQAADLYAWNLRRFRGLGEKFPAMHLLEKLPTIIHRVYGLKEMLPIFQKWAQLSGSS